MNWANVWNAKRERERENDDEEEKTKVSGARNDVSLCWWRRRRPVKMFKWMDKLRSTIFVVVVVDVVTFLAYLKEDWYPAVQLQRNALLFFFFFG